MHKKTQDCSGERFRMQIRSSRAFTLYTVCTFKQHYNYSNSLISQTLVINFLTPALLEELFLKQELRYLETLVRPRVSAGMVLGQQIPHLFVA